MRSRIYLVLFVVAVAAWTLASAGCATSAPTPTVPAVNWPQQDVNFIVTYKPGGAFDSTARILAPYIQKNLPKSVNVVVQNVAGAGGMTGVDQLLRAKPDGYTIGVVDTILLAQMQSDKQLPPGATVDSITYLARARRAPETLAVPANSKIKSFDDLKALKGQKVRFSATADDTFLVLVLAKAMGFEPLFVLADGGPEAAQNAIRGDADVFANSLAGMSRHVVTYPELKPILIGGDQRAPIWPSVPNLAELGYATIAPLWDTSWAIVSPPGVPANIQKMLEDAIVKALSDPAAIADLTKASLSADPSSGADIKARTVSLTQGYEANKDVLKLLPK